MYLTKEFDMISVKDAMENGKRCKLYTATYKSREAHMLLISWGIVWS